VKSTNRFQLLGLCLLVGFAGAGTSPATAQSGQPLIVNIDNPSFRKLIVATPAFIVEKGGGDDLKALGVNGSKELSRLLIFSGMFNAVSEDAYKDLAPGLEKGVKDNPDGFVEEPAMRGLRGIDVVQWKAIGVESLTVGVIGKDKDGYNLGIRTIDINRSELVLGKKYRKIKEKEFHTVIRRYADLLLEAYTGKPGIFSSKLVFIGRRSKKAAKQVFVSDFDGGNVVQITTGEYPHLSPAWSADGKSISYTSFERGNVDLYSYDLATGKKKVLSREKGLNSGANYAPDNSLIAFTGSVQGDSDIYTIAPAGGARKLLIKGSGLDVDPAFSPDKKWIAFVSGRYGNPHIFRATIEWDPSGGVKVTEDKRLTYAGWYNATPAWSPGSDKIAFTGYDKDIDRWDLFIMDPDGKKLERLTIRSGDNESPSWSPNGQMIVFHSNRAGASDVKAVPQLFMMNRDGSGQRKIETGLYEAQTPKWSRPLE